MTLFRPLGKRTDDHPDDMGKQGHRLDGHNELHGRECFAGDGHGDLMSCNQSRESSSQRPFRPRKRRDLTFSPQRAAPWTPGPSAGILKAPLYSSRGHQQRRSPRSPPSRRPPQTMQWVASKCWISRARRAFSASSPSVYQPTTIRLIRSTIAKRPDSSSKTRRYFTGFNARRFDLLHASAASRTSRHLVGLCGLALRTASRAVVKTSVHEALERSCRS